MPKKVVLALAAFFLASFLVVLINPASQQILLTYLNNADILFPFSVYQGFNNPASHGDWVFGGNTPFLELLIGFVLWLLTKNVTVTFLLYAVFQLVVVTLTLMFLARTVYGKSWKISALVILFSAATVLLFSTGRMKAAYLLFLWYHHITTLCMALAALALLIRFTTAPARNNKALLGDAALMGAIIIIAALSDTLIIAQFVAPAVVLVTGMFLLKMVPFRRAAIAGLTILYATGAGLAMYRLPNLWGSDRIALYGSYVKPSIERIAGNWNAHLAVISSIWEELPWTAVVWVLFYLLCLAATVRMFWRLRNAQGASNLRRRVLLLFSFILLQLGANFLSGLIAETPAVRYLAPMIFFPLFWGWTFLALETPAWMKLLRAKGAAAASYSLMGLTLLLLLIHAGSARLPSNPLDYYPDLARCLDEQKSQYGLQIGMGNYWQARPVSLYSKTGLLVVQVNPDLTPLRILNSTDGYREALNFFIVSNDLRPGHWMLRHVVTDRFGEPAAAFFCGESEVLVYNRESDTAFRKQFTGFFEQ